MQVNTVLSIYFLKTFNLGASQSKRSRLCSVYCCKVCNGRFTWLLNNI